MRKFLFLPQSSHRSFQCSLLLSFKAFFAFPAVFLIFKQIPPFPSASFSKVNISAQNPSKSHGSISEDIENAAQVDLLNPNHNLHQEIHTTVHQVVDANNSLRDIDKACYCVLEKSFRSYNCGYVRGMKIEYVSYFFSPEDEIHVASVRSVDGMMSLTDGYRVTMLIGRHQRPGIEMLSDEDCMSCALKPMHKRYAYRVDGKATLPAQMTNLSKIANILMAIVRRKATFPDTIQTVPRYTRALEKGYGARSVDVNIMDIAEDMIYSNFLAANS